MRLVASLASIAVIAYLAVLAYLYVYQRSLLYVPDKAHPVLGDLAQFGAHEIRLTTADGLSLFAWYLPPPEGRPVIVYFHGNGGNLGYRTDRFRRFAQERYGVLMPEYRGYADNPGEPTEAGLYADAAAALDFLAQQRISDRRLVLFGELLGSGVAVQLAVGRPIAALLLELPFTSVSAAAQYHYPYIPARWLIWDRFDLLSKIGRVSAPILVLIGGDDKIVPPAFSRTLFAAAPEPKEMFFAPRGGHVNLDRFGGLDAVVAFIHRHVAGGE